MRGIFGAAKYADATEPRQGPRGIVYLAGCDVGLEELKLVRTELNEMRFQLNPETPSNKQPFAVFAFIEQSMNQDCDQTVSPPPDGRSGEQTAIFRGGTTGRTKSTHWEELSGTVTTKPGSTR